MTVSSNGTPTLAAASASASMSVTGTWGSGQNRTAEDLLVAAVTCYGTTTAQLGAPPPGWRLDRSITANSQTTTAFFTKTAAGSDAAPTFTAVTTGTGGDSSLQVVLFDFSDSGGGTPIVAAEGAATGTSGTLAAATAQKVLASGSLGVLAGIASQGTTAATTTWTTPSGWTLAADQTTSLCSQMTSYVTSGAPSTGSTLSATLTHGRTSTEQSAVILVISPPGSVTGTTYYVSPSGSNSNAGTSTGAAWQTVAHVNGLTFSPGDTILFQGGQTFSAQLVPPSEGTSDLPVTFGSYGTGQATISVTAEPAIYALNVGGLTCQNLTLSGTAPSGDYNGGFHFEAGDGGQHPAVTVTGCSASGFQWGATAIGDTNWSGFGTVTITGCTLNGNTYAGVYTNAQGNPGVYTFGQVTVTGNTCSSNPGQTGGTTDPSGFGIYVGAAGAGLVSGNVIANNGASNPNSATGVCGILIGCSDGVIVSGNVIYGQSGNASDGDGIDLDTYCISCTVEYNIIYNCTSAGILLFALGGLWGGNVVRFNVLWGNCTGGFGFFGELSLFETIDSAAYIYNNTIVAHGGGASASGPFFCDDSLSITGSVSVWNNIFYSATTQILYTHVAFTTGEMELQGNCWYYSGTPNWNWAGTTYTSLSAFQTGTGQEKLSGSPVGVQANPGLVTPGSSPSVTSPSNLTPASGMMLAAGSPCIAAGLPLLADFSVSPGGQDFFGSALGALPIGAVTYALSGAPPPLIPPGFSSPMAFAAFPPRPLLPPAPVAVSDSDTGSGVDTGSAAIAVSGADTGAGADTASVFTPVFPQVPLGVKVELDLAGTWTDVTTYCLQREGTSPPIQITRGRPDESAQVNPSAATLQLNNRDGRFTVLNPTGPYYGQLSRNTPVRVSVPASGVYLRLEQDTASNAVCADASALHITGDIDIRLDVALSNIADKVLCSKWDPYGTPATAWMLILNGDATLALWWSDDGSDAHVVNSTMPVMPMGRQCVRATLQVNNGAGGYTATFYTGAAGGADGSTWTQLGSQVIGSSTTSIYAATSKLAVGDYDLTSASSGGGGINGSVYEFELRSGIAGTVVAHPVFSSQSAGATSFSDAQSNTWSMTGTAELSNRSYRYHGEMSSLPVTWDTSGKDVWVPVAAGGLLRRIGQGNAPLDSALKRAVRSQTGTLAVHQYWPCEDLQGSTSIGSATGGPAMMLTGGTGDGTLTTTGPAFAADSSFLCSNSLPTVNDSSWIGQVPAYSSNGSIVVRFLMYISTPPTTGARIMRVITTGTCTELSCYYGGSGELGLAGYNSSGTVFDSTAAAFAADGEHLWVSMELRPGGGSTVDWALVTLQPGASSGLLANGTFTGTIGNVTECYMDPYQEMTAVTIGHISVQSDWESLFNFGSPFNAWQGETAGARFARLCAENGFASRLYGPPVTTAPMGAQAPAALTSLLQECEDADHGQIFEPRQALALGYRPLAAITSQAAAVTADYSQTELAGADLMPTYDDQFSRNDLTVQRSSGSVSGSSFRYELNDGSAMSITGVGDYSDSKSVNVYQDSQLPDQAGWLVHIGTVNEARWPMLPLNLARSAVSGIFYAILGADIGDFAEVTSPPAWLPPDPVKQLIYGTKESLGGFFYQVEWNTVPESPFEVALLDDTTYGRADTDGSTLHASATSGATSITVDSASATYLWTTVAADCPFDIAIGGERITVTAVSGSSSPQTFTVTRAVNGVSKAQTAGADVRLWFPPIQAML